MVLRIAKALLFSVLFLIPTKAFLGHVPVAGRRSKVGILPSLGTSNVALSMVSTSSSTPSSSTTSKRRKKTVQDRSQEEAISLIRDVVQAVYEAGPRAGPARTLQAYNAVINTIRDFMPRPGRPAAEEFSFPVALRKLFERLGATYIKLGQFVASSPTLFPKEYVLEFQKCLDATEPLDWSVIKRVIEKELGTSYRVAQRSLASPISPLSLTLTFSLRQAPFQKRLLPLTKRLLLPLVLHKYTLPNSRRAKTSSSRYKSLALTSRSRRTLVSSTSPRGFWSFCSPTGNELRYQPLSVTSVLPCSRSSTLRRKR